jgi:alpha-L-fucosidase
MSRRFTAYRRGWLIIAAVLAVTLGRQAPAAERNAPPHARSRDLLTAQPEAIRAWQDMRFGMFVCWGPVSLTGEEIGWSRGAPRGHGSLLIQGQGTTPGEVYDRLYTKWRPDRFQADQWVQLAREAGQKYMIFLVKHHDGFCLYDSRLTDYKSTGPESAWKHDVMADVARACHARGLKLIVYYSQPDWHHPDYGTARHCRYIDYLHGQLRELLSGYGRIEGLWFDLGGRPADWDSENLFCLMRGLQPWLVINDRCGLRGDYDTPEQRLGAFQLDRPWETCMTLGTQWSWRPDDRIKSLKECIDVLVTCAGRNGNLALNTGPMPDGRIEPRQADRFREIGRWLSRYGQSIYATRGGPFVGLHCLSTRCGRHVYVHVLEWHAARLRLPPIARRIVASRLLAGGTATVRQTESGIEISVPPQHRQELDTIIQLDLDGPADELKPAPLAAESLTLGKKVTASSFYRGPGGTWGVNSLYCPEHAVDGDPGSGWTFDPGLKSGWLEVDLGRPLSFGSVEIRESFDRVRAFRVQAKRDDQWVTVCHGQRIGEHYQASFPAVTARWVRLEVLDTTINPLVTEFHVYPPD